jgi:hypothetical protein
VNQTRDVVVIGATVCVMMLSLCGVGFVQIRLFKDTITDYNYVFQKLNLHHVRTIRRPLSNRVSTNRDGNIYFSTEATV